MTTVVEDARIVPASAAVVKVRRAATVRDPACVRCPDGGMAATTKLRPGR
jgi:hypothetical protein